MNDLQSERLRIRKIVDSDIENIFRGLSDPNVYQYYAVSYDTLEKTKEQMAWYKNLEETKTGIWWAITSKEDGQFYGGIGYNDWNHEHRKAEIGIWLIPQYWGKGIMTESMNLVLKHGFEKMNLHRVEAYVRIENMACKKALKKLNFKFEGTTRDGEIKDDKFISYETHSILKHECKYDSDLV